MITAKIIEDSLHPDGETRLTTFVLKYPRFIHSEFMTHRMFSRNASSSRAIPVKRQIEMVEDEPAIPLAFRKNQAGMQAGAVLKHHDEVVALWLEARDHAVEIAKKMAAMEVHKQYANRVLEPWAHITVVCTATDWANFLALRIHQKAMPEIAELAMQMYQQLQEWQPTLLVYGEWHLPFVLDGEKEAWYTDSQRAGVNPIELIKCSVARCARVSYLNHEGKTPTRAEDLQLYDRLLMETPIHASPAEHQAVPSIFDEYVGNLYRWKQYRKMLANENITAYTGTGRIEAVNE